MLIYLAEHLIYQPFFTHRNEREKSKHFHGSEKLWKTVERRFFIGMKISRAKWKISLFRKLMNVVTENVSAS